MPLGKNVQKRSKVLLAGFCDLRIKQKSGIYMDTALLLLAPNRQDKR